MGKFIMNLKDVKVKPDICGQPVVNFVFEAGLKDGSLLKCGYCGDTSAVNIIQNLMSSNPKAIVCPTCLGAYTIDQLKGVYGKEALDSQIFAVQIPENTAFNQLNGLGFNNGIQALRKHLFYVNDKTSLKDVNDVELELRLANDSRLQFVLNGIGFYLSGQEGKEPIKAEGSLPELKLTAGELKEFKEKLAKEIKIL